MDRFLIAAMSGTFLFWMLALEASGEVGCSPETCTTAPRMKRPPAAEWKAHFPRGRQP
jgi:hypothetical protein